MNPRKSVKPIKADLVYALDHLKKMLQRDFGCDFSFQVMGNGFTIAKSNSDGVVIPTMETMTHDPEADALREKLWYSK